MKRLIIYISFMCFSIFNLQAQDIVNAEYFFDSDPGVGNAISLPNFSANDTVNLSLNISISGLNPGFHTLYIRFQDANSKWGIYEGQAFFIEAGSGNSAAPDLASAEYFFDTDPGVGNGTALPNFTASDTVNLNFNANFSSLSVGQHTVFVRFRDAQGKWGIYEGMDFTILSCNAPAADFSFASLTVCEGDSIVLSDNSTGAIGGATYEWDINNDGSIEGTTSSIGFVVVTNQSFDVKYVVSNGACRDSVIRTFQVDTVNVGVTQNGVQLTANQSGATYQWLDCNNSFAVITGATSQQYTALANGAYAVEVSRGACVDTSNCINVISVGLQEEEVSLVWKVYPNPTADGNFTIEFGEELKEAQLRLLDLSGKVVWNELLRDQSAAQFHFEQAKGIYFLEIQQEGKREIKKLVFN